MERFHAAPFGSINDRSGEMVAEFKEYGILMANFPESVPSDNFNAPWNTQIGEFDFSNAKFETVTIRDDDSEFKSGRSDATETQQIATKTTGIIGKGTKLSNYPGSVIQDSSGNSLFVTYPWTFRSGSNGGKLLGDKKSVLIFPLKKRDTDEYSSFDPKGAFTFVSPLGQGTRDTFAIPYEPQARDEPHTKVPCFAAGTMIGTTEGERPIEMLRSGDLVLTRDMGPQRIRWIGESRVDARHLDLCPNLRPVRIAIGSLGQHIPDRDLHVSPQHRILLRSPKTRRLFDEDEVLVAAKHLTGLPGIDVVLPDDGVTYWHMLFDRHQVVLSNGAWTESLYPGPMAIQSLSPAAKREIFSLFPQLRNGTGLLQASRRMLNGAEGRKIARRQAKNSNKPLFADPVV